MGVTELREQTCPTEEVGDGTQTLAEKASKKRNDNRKEEEGGGHRTGKHWTQENNFSLSSAFAGPVLSSALTNLL